ncbi:MAG: nuclear transport factor 2 family protein [Deltaproteobacteria bacterium]|nr:nuclear transport factor 2 family protein [Deltaproteobacteria bacterium]
MDGAASLMTLPLDGPREAFSLDPFRLVVRARVRRSFARLSEGDPSAALALMRDDVRYTFEGAHALGGTRVSRAGVERWFGRLLRLLPGRFTIRRVDVVGWPWRATVYVVFEDEVRPAYGAPYRNHGVQVVELAWGKAARIHTYVDTAKVSRALDVLAASGVEEAHAAPITG